METLYYILNTKTDESYDTTENKFYNNSWEPEWEEDGEWLQSLIDADPEKFENCIVFSTELETAE